MIAGIVNLIDFGARQNFCLVEFSVPIKKFWVNSSYCSFMGESSSKPTVAVCPGQNPTKS